jgi:hypothetical protein
MTAAGFLLRVSTFAVAILGLLLLGRHDAVMAQSGLEIMQKQRSLQRARDETETSTMKIFSKAGEVKLRRIASYSLTAPDSLSKTLLRFLAPRDVENTALLTWEGKEGDDDQWLYLPATRKVKRIAASGKKNRFMGSDFSYEDLRPENLALHTYTFLKIETLDEKPCFVIEARPVSEHQAADSGYSRRKLWIRTDNHFTVKQEYYDKKGRLAKIGISRNVVLVQGTIWRAEEVEMSDVQAGSKTVMVNERRALDSGVKDSFFTESELVRGGS